MHDLIDHAADIIFKEGLGDDAHEATTVALTNMTWNAATLQMFALSIRGMRMTDKRRERINGHLGQILFCAAALIHINQLDPNDFDIELLTGFAETFHPDYHHDAILCVNQIIGNASSLLELMFDVEESPLIHGNEEYAETELKLPGMVEVLSADEEFMEGMSLDDLDESVFDTELEMKEDSAKKYLYCIVASVLILASRFDTDIDVVTYNSQLIDDF